MLRHTTILPFPVYPSAQNADLEPETVVQEYQPKVKLSGKNSEACLYNWLGKNICLVILNTCKQIFYEKGRTNVLVTTKRVGNLTLVFPSCEKEHLDFERSILHEISNLDLALPNHLPRIQGPM
jgi:hypothetical protein